MSNKYVSIYNLLMNVGTDMKYIMLCCNGPLRTRACQPDTEFMFTYQNAKLTVNEAVTIGNYLLSLRQYPSFCLLDTLELH